MSLVINIILLVGLLPLFKANTFLKTRYCASLMWNLKQINLTIVNKNIIYFWAQIFVILVGKSTTWNIS
jgi:hypothetical protein